MTSFYDFTVTSLDGTAKSQADYRGQVVLVVNTATSCGLTPQYKELETLYQTYVDQGFVVLDFPSNQFLQALEDSQTIDQICQLTYGTSFPRFAKVMVNGPEADPLFVWLKNQAKGLMGEAIKWNFTKFLIGRDGQVIDRFAPTTSPKDLEQVIKNQL